MNEVRSSERRPNPFADTGPAGERRIVEFVQSVRAVNETGFPVLVTTIGWIESTPAQFGSVYGSTQSTLNVECG
jgi:hypothetical protein